MEATISLRRAVQPLLAHDPEDRAVSAFCAAVLNGLRRSNQRDKGMLYLSGLLSARGRKTVRNIASPVGDRAVEQSLHHFVANSTWADAAVRGALARRLDRAVRPMAWVVEPMTVVKAGTRSVGVSNAFVPQLGRVANNQQAVGLWLATEGLSFPVNWRLVLPPEWLDDKERRRRAEIPDDLAAVTPEECAVDAVVEAAEDWRLNRRAVVLDARHGQLAPVIGEFSFRAIPALLRVDGDTELLVTEPSVPGYGAGPVTAARLAASLKGLRLPVPWHEGTHRTDARATLAVAARVVLPTVRGRAGASARPHPLVLLAEWDHAGQPARRFWIATFTSGSPAALVRLTRLTRQVRRDFAEVGTAVGLRDFEGRSFRGWHHHVTLASAAHAIVSLSSAGLLGEATKPAEDVA
ncbi:transposase [Streptomyces sp. W16]|uniref:IS701 family transposase n=1 Tax=Streptomyces sp. W16 TaxID=3076631 RepID=UPI00295ACBCF|nr:transposase [Streptomyces sp. W16]MDV9169071.1 transposase [Streptomyces sp. W16]